MLRQKHCLKDLTFLFTRQHELWNEVHLRIAMITAFTWYTAVKTVF